MYPLPHASASIQRLPYQLSKLLSRWTLTCVKIWIRLFWLIITLHLIFFPSSLTTGVDEQIKKQVSFYQRKQTKLFFKVKYTDTPDNSLIIHQFLQHQGSMDGHQDCE